MRIHSMQIIMIIHAGDVRYPQVCAADIRGEEVDSGADAFSVNFDRPTNIVSKCKELEEMKKTHP